SRQQLLQVPRLGEKAFEQCAGFLRIPQAEQPLDNSAVHPESYELVAQIAADLQVTVDQLAGNEALLNKVQPQRYAQHGLHRVQDIIKELKKPGLDPRQGAEAFEFAAVYAITDLQVGMELPGIVTNLTRFGAFIDVGVKQDGLVHVSEIAHRYISDPAEALKLGQKVRVKVLEVDAARKRVALSIKQTEAPQGSRQHSQPNASRPKNTPRPQMQQQAGTMQDALAALKRKFGK
ncbi:MAG TPA: S1 RNA-binding domain-containing protein, partial [Phnomibacter sp.]|nr:S1 RNA-binding domain-containing protein [Phnomibacter sp.]